MTNVLYLEDEYEALADNAEILEACGFNVIQASSPKEALAAIQDKNTPIDIALLDINMEKVIDRAAIINNAEGKPMDGIDVAAEIQKIQPMPFIFLSVYLKRSLTVSGHFL